MTFDYASSTHVTAVRQRLSVERLATYDQWARGDDLASLRRYEWNTDASAACYAALQAVEVVLRNAVHQQLTAFHAARGLPGDWLDDADRLLDPRGRLDIAEARRRVARYGRPQTPGRLIAELPFGFWRYLLSARYEQSLWTPALRHAFPYLQPQRRIAIARRVERLHLLRNRVAHHEPIHRRDLAADYRDMVAVVAAICPHTSGWMSAVSRMPGAITARPRATAAAMN